MYFVGKALAMNKQGTAFRNYERRSSTKAKSKYAAESELRYNNRLANGVDDKRRVESALIGLVGKRVLYRDSLSA